MSAADPARPRPTFEAFTPLRAVIGAVLVGIVVLRWTWEFREIPFDSDEANHANIALRQYQDLAAGDWMDFLRHSYRTGQFPFLHGWSILPFYAVLGVTEFAARAAQVLWFVAGTLATAIAAGSLVGRRDGVAGPRGILDAKRVGGLAGGLFVLSPLLAVFAGLCMLETPGAAATAIALAFFAAGAGRTGGAAVRLDVCTALAVAATYFVKHNYGFGVLPAIGLGYVVLAADRDTRRRGLVGLAVYVGVLVAIAGAWYASPSQRAALLGFFTNPAQAVPVVEDDPGFRIPGFHLENFLGYPPLLANDYHLHWSVGALVGVGFLLGLVRVVRERHAAGIAAASCFLWTWIALSLGFREYPMARFIAPALPALWIVAAYGALPVLTRLGDVAWGQVLLRFGLLGALVAQALVVPPILRAESEGRPEHRAFFTTLASGIPAPADVLLLNYDDRTSARTLTWALGTRPGGTYRDHVVKGIIAERIYESPRELDEWFSKPRPYGDRTWRSIVAEVHLGPTHDTAQPETQEMWRRELAKRADRLQLLARFEFPESDASVILWEDTTPPARTGTDGKPE